VKILPDEVYRPTKLPDIETVADLEAIIDFPEIKAELRYELQKLLSQEINSREEVVYKALMLANAISKKVTSVVFKLIYNEERIVTFIDFCEQEEWLPKKTTDICREDMAKESVQEIFSLQAEIESVALTVAAFSEIFSGSGGWQSWVKLYAVDSSLRLTLSYLLSRNVVLNRAKFAQGQGVPHLGRLTSIKFIAKEHPELARLLLAYKACRKFPENKNDPNFDITSAQEEFNSRFYSDAVDAPFKSIALAGLSTLSDWINKNPVSHFSLQASQIIGLR